jgi:hypothetical protein
MTTETRVWLVSVGGLVLAATINLITATTWLQAVAALSVGVGATVGFRRLWRKTTRRV